MSKKQKRTMSKQAFGITIIGRGSSRRLAKRAMWKLHRDCLRSVSFVKGRFADTKYDGNVLVVQEAFRVNKAFFEEGQHDYDLLDLLYSYMAVFTYTHFHDSKMARQCGKTVAFSKQTIWYLYSVHFIGTLINALSVDNNRQSRYCSPIIFYPKKEIAA